MNARLPPISEPSVRTELVEQLPNIAVFCASEAGPLENVVREHVVPILVQYLTDVTNQVTMAQLLSFNVCDVLAVVGFLT